MLHVNWNKVSKFVEETPISYKDSENSDQTKSLGLFWVHIVYFTMHCLMYKLHTIMFVQHVQYHILLRVQIWSARFAISPIARKRTMLSSIKFDPPFCFMAT